MTPPRDSHSAGAVVDVQIRRTGTSAGDDKGLSRLSGRRFSVGGLAAGPGHHRADMPGAEHLRRVQMSDGPHYTRFRRRPGFELTITL
jgi:hypothetical protein